MLPRKILPAVVLIAMFAVLARGLQRPAESSVAAPQKGRASTETSVQVPDVPDLIWFSSKSAVDRALELQHLHGSVQGRGWTPTAVVLSQSPAPGRHFVPNGQVNYTLGEPQLSLKVDNPTPPANQPANFSLSLQPPLRASAEFIGAVSAPQYQLFWDDGSNPEPPLPTPAAPHVFRRPGEHVVYAVAMVMGKKLISNKLTITSGFQEVVLQPDTTRPQAGTADGFTARATPEAAPGARVEYCFHWADRSPDTCGISTSPHVYATTGSFQPTVTATINRVATTVSAPVEIQVQPVPISARLTGPSYLGEGQPGVFKIEVSPPPAVTDKARYCFRWEASAPFDCQDSPEASHPFDARGSHMVSAEVKVNNLTTPAEPRIKVSVSAYDVTLRPDATSLESGRSENFRALLKPSPATGIKIEYCFRWDDGSGEDCRTVSSASHVYSSRGTYHPLVAVLINGQPAGSSDSVTVKVGLPWSSMIPLIAMALVGTLAGGFSVHKVSKLLRPRITPHAGTADLRIANPGSLTKGPAVRIGCVCPPPTVTLIAPGPVVKKKKEASHA